MPLTENGFSSWNRFVEVRQLEIRQGASSAKVLPLVE
jgi:hypothetical protein